MKCELSMSDEKSVAYEIVRRNYSTGGSQSGVPFRMGI
jgi:hypothetical protein